MPTKASEYMISGIPILVLAPRETAISQFFTQHECGFCVSTKSSVELSEAMAFLIDNEDYRNKISTNAVKIAMARFDVSIVRDEFQKLLINLKNTLENVHK